MGYKIVLTASRTEMSDFNLNPFRAFLAGFPSGIIPTSILRKKVYPLVPSNNGYAPFAPYGLRKIEAMLKERFGEENVAVVYPTELQNAVDENTKVIGISTMDPLGLAYVSVTYSSILGIGNKCLNALEFEELMKEVSRVRKNARVIVGGQGSAQILDAKMADKLGIDTLVIGEGEGVVLDLFERAIKGEELPRVVYGKLEDARDVPVINAPSLYGAVEITRGCGRGCQFCTPTMRKLHSFPIEHIMREVEINARGGTRMIMLVTEDLFLYKVLPKFVPNREEVVKLIKRVASVEGVEYLQVTHTSWPPVVYDRKMLEEISEIMLEKTYWQINGVRYISDIIGIETGSIRLMEKYMRGKALPYDVKMWRDIVIEGAGIYNDNGWYPGGTIITGWPDENAADTIATLELIDELRGVKVILIPLLFVPFHEAMLKNASRVDLKDLSDLQWDFIATCWSHNVREFVPELRRKIMAISTFLMPFYYLKHGRNFIGPAIKFAYLNQILDIKKIKRKYEKYREKYEEIKEK
ncbi:MAG: hypothetical protein DRN20_06545, partial [Thermoplasmata archaeon]